ncbi:MAG: hypothetical protein CSA58_08995 [Micrococcales bacterium]|nr:MAG: hypothetical protein CSB46_08030 [Micrococcales bacterium]PIE26521.1 MAG: hypothetical protein CSA58_08995 [Micrococcales bacterium]
MLNSPVWRGLPVSAFGLGLVVGALVSATVVLTAGSLVRVLAPDWVWVWVVVAWFAVVAVREFGWLHIVLPQNARLVPQTVFRHGRFFGPFQFGLEMGTGVRTYVTSGLPYVLVPVIAFLASWPAAVCVGVGFGLGRLLMTAANLRFGNDGQWDDVFARHQRTISVLLVAGFAVSLAAVVASLPGHPLGT